MSDIARNLADNEYLKFNLHKIRRVTILWILKSIKFYVTEIQLIAQKCFVVHKKVLLKEVNILLKGVNILLNEVNILLNEMNILLKGVILPLYSKKIR